MGTFFGRILDFVTGRSIPKRVRRDLVLNVIADHPDTIKAAFPGRYERDLVKALEAELVEIVKEAASASPSHRTIFAENVMRVALRQRFQTETDPDRREMLTALGNRLLRDWYPASASQNWSGTQ